MGRTFHLQHGHSIVRVAEHPVVIGRDRAAEFSLDDPAIAPRHAVLEVINDRLWVRDLSAQGGVRVNGRPISQSVLDANDVLALGAQQFIVLADRPVSGRHVRGGTTISGEYSGPSSSTSSPDGDWSTIQQLIASGQLDAAQRDAAALLHRTLVGIANGMVAASALADGARVALALAAATGKGTWIDWVFRAYHAASAILPPETIDEIHSLARKTHYKVNNAAKSYVESLSRRVAELSPSERFIVQRIQGLLRTLLAA